MLSAFLLETLCDPKDHGSLLYVPSESVLLNPRRNVTYAVTNGVAVMMPEEVTPVSADEAARLAALPGVIETGKA
jgi:uncharacterized protein YbaR (Trm112 family)